MESTIADYKLQQKRKAHKKWRDKNKEDISIRNKNYYKANKEYFKNYYKTNPSIKAISQWKQSGVIGDLPTIYKIYNYATHCDYCNRKIGQSLKVLDHCHTCGCVRGIICRAPCNSMDKLKCHLCDDPDYIEAIP